MLRALLLCIGFILLGPASQGQTYGLLLGGCYTDVYASGQVLTPSHGLRAGIFMPVYVHNRLVLRAEAGVTAFKPGSVETEQDGATPTYASVSLTALGRYYLTPSVCFSIGAEWNYSLQEPPTVVYNHLASVPGRTDIAALAGAAYRFKDRVELGLRYGQGLRPATTIDIYGTARHRYGFIMASYLLKHRAQGFMARRNWRKPMAMASRY